MRAIYKPKGRAGEYAGLACNLALGCSHGCAYCYAPRALHMSRDGFHAAGLPRPGILEALDRDARCLWGKGPANVFLCFSCDPFQPSLRETTRQAIRRLNQLDLGATILTKGVLRDPEDFLLLKEHPRNEFGMTLTLCSVEESQFWEPAAALPERRLWQLDRAKSLGIRTWVSCEPVLDPDQTLALIEASHRFVDHYKVGKLNYHPRAREIDWPAFRTQAVELLERLGCDYYIKRELREAA